MAISRARAKGRRGGEREPFALLPANVMQSPALATAPHAAFRVLAVLLVGKPKERNGALMCSDSYAATYGLTSHDTLARSLRELTDRGLIVVTRRVQKLRRWPALFAVTWWPSYYRDGQLLDAPEPATHAYRDWQPKLAASPRPSGYITPTIGVKESAHHPDLPPETANLHPDSRGNSKNLGARPDPSGSSGRDVAPVSVRTLLARSSQTADDSNRLAIRNLLEHGYSPAEVERLLASRRVTRDQVEAEASRRD